MGTSLIPPHHAEKRRIGIGPKFTKFLPPCATKGSAKETAMSRLGACLFVALILCAYINIAKAAGYRDYAERIVSSPPEGATFRDDLEKVLDARASQYRKKKRRGAVASSPLFETAARAQALDMMAMGKSGHRSRKGDGFEARFKVFRPDPEMQYNAGENIASDRRRGEAGKEKALRLFEMWVDSTGHRRNLLNDQFKYVSSGVVQRGNELWAVQIFWSDPVKTNILFQIQ
jgi:uncharacterized protein YkwD